MDWRGRWAAARVRGHPSPPAPLPNRGERGTRAAAAVRTAGRRAAEGSRSQSAKADFVWFQPGFQPGWKADFVWFQPGFHPGSKADFV